MSRKYPYEYDFRNYEYEYTEDHVSSKRDEFGLYYKKRKNRNGKSKIRKFLTHLEGTFKVKYDDGTIEEFVINDHNTNIDKHEVSSNSPLAIGAHKTKEGNYFDIPGGKVFLIRKNLDWKDYPHDKKYDAYRNIKYKNKYKYSLKNDEIIQDNIECDYLYKNNNNNNTSSVNNNEKYNPNNNNKSYTTYNNNVNFSNNKNKYVSVVNNKNNNNSDSNSKNSTINQFVILIIICILLSIIIYKSVTRFLDIDNQMSLAEKNLSKARSKCLSMGNGWHLEMYGCGSGKGEDLLNPNCVWGCRR